MSLEYFDEIVTVLISVTSHCTGAMTEKNGVEKVLGKFWLYSLIASISLARLGSGMFISIHGPTLLSLADNVGVDVSQVSWVFTGRSLGVLVGSIITGYIMKNANNIFSFAIATVLLGIVLIAIPWINSLALLAVVVMVGGITFGYLDSGMQALILQVWGEKDSRPLIAAFHFTVAVGACLAPIIAGPFLNQKGSTDSYEICPVNDEELPLNVTESPINTTTTAHSSINPIAWAYLICGVFMVGAGVLFALLGCNSLESKARSTRGDVTEKRDEENIKDMWFFFVLICGFYFCVVAETVYQSFIYSVAVCSDLSLEPNQATWLNAVYWTGLGLGRLAGIVISKYLLPRTMIIGDFIGTIATMTIQSIFGEKHLGVTWSITFLFAFFQATIYPSGVSWSSQFTNMSGHYIFIFTCGLAIGQTFLLPLGGFLFQRNPFNVMYLVLCATTCNAIFYFFMVLNRKYNKRPKLKDEKVVEINNITKF